MGVSLGVWDILSKKVTDEKSPIPFSPHGADTVGDRKVFDGSYDL
jgi:hypothetical protein